MTVVVDLGCAEHDGESSIGRLLERYRPEFFYGFDPLLLDDDVTYVEGATTVRLRKQAAWTEDGSGELGIGGHTLLDATLLADKNANGEWRKSIAVEFFDFGAFLEGFEEPVVAKMNVEGAEFPLLEDLVERGLDRKIRLLYIAWHDDRMGAPYTGRRLELQGKLRCALEPWYLW